jgi:hypothetical protein
LGSARRGSNPLGVDFFDASHAQDAIRASWNCHPLADLRLNHANTRTNEIGQTWRLGSARKRRLRGANNHGLLTRCAELCMAHARMIEAVEDLAADAEKLSMSGISGAGPGGVKYGGVGWGGCGGGGGAPAGPAAPGPPPPGGDGCLFEDGRFLVEDGAALELAARDGNASQKGSARQLRHFGRAV